MKKKKVVYIYDSLNKQVFVAGKDNSYKRFDHNGKARAYAIAMARKNNGKVYDEYFGRYIPTKKKKTQTKSPFGGFGGFGNFRGPSW